MHNSFKDCDSESCLNICTNC